MGGDDVTTEDDFQRALDENQTDWQTRLVFADWLDERDDPRAEGYRALGALLIYPFGQPDSDCWFHDGTYAGGNDRNAIPHDWFSLLPASDTMPNANVWPLHAKRKSRREVESIAALAFTMLPAARRAELLNQQPASVT